MRLFCILFLFSPLFASATGQGADRFIWNGDTLNLYTYPLNSHPAFAKPRPLLFGTENPPFNTGCWRGYIAEWELLNDTLYLSKLYTCDYPSNKTKADLERLFPSQLKNGKLPASWFSGNLLIGRGRLLYYTFNYISIYEKETELSIRNGAVTKTQEFDNTKTQLSVYAENSDSLVEFIAQNINWKILPDLGQQTKKVFVRILSGAQPRPDSIILLKKTDEAILNEEALRVLRLLPSWSCYYKRGQVHRIDYMLPIVFDENRRKKYLKP